MEWKGVTGGVEQCEELSEYQCELCLVLLSHLQAHVATTTTDSHLPTRSSVLQRGVNMAQQRELWLVWFVILMLSTVLSAGLAESSAVPEVAVIDTISDLLANDISAIDFSANDDPPDDPSNTDDPTDDPSNTDDPTDDPSNTDDPTDDPSNTDDPTDDPSNTDDPTDDPSNTDDPTEEPPVTDTPEQTEEPPHQDEQLFTETSAALTSISETLGDFLVLVSAEPTHGDKASKESQVHPAEWWTQRRRVARKALPKVRDVGSMCVNPTANNLCNEIESVLEEINSLVLSLIGNVLEWTEAKLEELKDAKILLGKSYTDATEEDTFLDSVDKTVFIVKLASLQEIVTEGKKVADEQARTLGGPTGTNSVVFVAVVGTVSGILIVALLGILVYTGINFKKAKAIAQNQGSTPYKKGENIPEDTGRNIPEDTRQGSYPPPRLGQLPAPAQGGRYGMTGNIYNRS